VEGIIARRQSRVADHEAVVDVRFDVVRNLGIQPESEQQDRR
jgi:hypothetical protein